MGGSGKNLIKRRDREFKSPKQPIGVRRRSTALWKASLLEPFSLLKSLLER